jgi:hypothetical protein
MCGMPAGILVIKTKSTVKALDNLLLTQKLKDFDWSDNF